MKKFLLSLLRKYIIKKMNEKYFGSQLQNDVLKALGLREKGVPKMENPPELPIHFDGVFKKLAELQVTEALEQKHDCELPRSFKIYGDFPPIISPDTFPVTNT